ncbi:MAG: hypothetical protein ORN27_04315, partial [Rhodoluna sp.]|nr:hypothetical protein [Rhodoluna sp.]
VGNYSDLSSGAGAITLAGSTTATETSPTGFALAGTGSYGVNVGTGAVATDSVKFTTTTGDITVRGKLVSGSGAGMGVSLWSGANLTSTTGAITVDGASYQPTGALQGHALYLNTSGGFTTTITTGDTSGTAIAIRGIVTSGASSGTNAYGVIAWAGTGANNISATGGGDISITGLASTNTDEAIALNKSNVYATSGNISLNGGTQRVAFGQNGANTIGGSASAANHTGNVNICAGNVAFSTATVTTLRTSGALVIEPCSGSFTVAQSWSSADVTMAAGSARFGRTGNTGNITTSVALSTKGDVEVIGGAITYNGTGVTTSGDASDIIVTASGAFAGSAPLSA